jgi:hypothetical protein
MKTKFLLALFIALTLALSITPAYAQGGGVGRSANVCVGGNSTFEPGDRAIDFTLLGCNGTVRSGATVPGDALVFGGNLIVEKGSTVNGNVAIFGGNATILGEVKGDVAILGGAVELDSTAVVDGSVRVVGGGLNQATGAVVRGSVTHENNLQLGPSFGRTFITPFNAFDGFATLGIGLFRSLITALALAALGALVVVFFPHPTQRVMATAQGYPGASVGVGCLTLVAAVVIFIPLFITLIGPFLLAIAVAAAWIFGWIAIGYLAGEKILEALKVKEIAPILAVVAGVLVLAVIGEVPCIGWLIALLIGTAGVGAVVLTRFGSRQYPFQPALVPVGPMPAAPGAGSLGPTEPPAPLPPAASGAS